MNYHLYNESKFLHIFENDNPPKTTVGFSRVEDYSLYKGLNGDWDTSYDYERYAKLYVRVDNKKVVIKRKYQDFMEFYADNSSLLITIFEILCIIFSFYDQLKANHSITKKLFFYEGIEQNQFQELKEIKNILYTTKEKDKDIKVFSSKVKDENPQMENPNTQTRPQSSKTVLVDTLVFKETDSNPTEITNQSDEKKLITYNSYSMYEMIKELLPSCCKTKDFEYKESLIRESHIILDSKLDIFLYIRNMLLFDAISQIYFDNSYIFNFLSRPIIFLNKKKEKIDKNELYEDSNELNFDILYERIQKLCIKPEKTKIEQNLIFLLKHKLNEVK
jgi:hypothetical protein